MPTNSLSHARYSTQASDDRLGLHRVLGTTIANLWKQSPKAPRPGHRCILNALSWQWRALTLEGGRMSWISLSDGIGRLVRKGSVDFALTACEVVELPGSNTTFALRPKEGWYWSGNDQHRQDGTNRVFIFDCTGSPLQRDEWLAQFRQHIAYGRVRDRGELHHYMSSMDAALAPVPEEAAVDRCCPICLDPLVVRAAQPIGPPGKDEDEAKAICRVACGHLFHVDCVRPWLHTSRSCPMCRLELL